MPSKSERQKILLELLKEYSLKTQTEVSEKLLACGYPSSQATISRDLRDLNIVKEVYSKKCRYTFLEQEGKQCAEHTIGEDLNRSIKECIVNVDCVNNIVFVETIPGFADALGACIDNIRDEKMLGCVARRNKVLIVMRDNEAADAFKKMLEKECRKERLQKGNKI